jgi:3-hydroxybutyryl-CoA dehydratase
MDDVRAVPTRIEGYFLEDLVVGMTAEYARTVTEADVVLFAGISGDNNPVHMNEVYAASTIFKGRIVHGMWSAGLISAALANKLPGPGTVYIGQNLKFRAPVRIGDTVTAMLTVSEIIPEKKRVTLKTVCTVGDTVVIDGEAIVMVPSRN